MSSESQEYNDSKESTNNEKKIDDKKQIENLMNVSYSYPDPADPELQKKIYEKREYILHRYNDRPDLNDYNDIKEYRDNICARSFTLHDHQAMLSNFINPDTPYKGVLVFHGLGSGKCISKCTKININNKLLLAHEIWDNNFTMTVEDTDGGEWSVPKKTLIVNSYDKVNNKIVKKQVLHLYREKVTTKLREIVLDNENKITITYIHKLFTQDGWSNMLSIGDDILCTSNNVNLEYSKIIKINEIDYDDYVYDLEIEDTHNFVTENIICHNTCVGVAIAEKFKSLVQKYNTKIVILVGGPLIKENWKQHLLLCTGETYLKYQDKSVYIDDVEKAKNEKMAMIQALQYYKFMSYKSFYKHVIGEKITDRQSDKKGKVTYRKTAEGEFERDVAIDRIYNLNNTLVVIDEAHNLTGNTYGEALKYIIKNSTNLKVILMSGTPMKNLGSDIIEMINFIRPLNSQIERDKVFNSEKGHLMDFKPGGLDYLKNMMRGYISHIRGADPLTFAKRYDKGIVPKGLMFTKVIRCDMLEFQKKTYMEAIEQNQEDTLDRKSEAVANFVFPVLSTDKKELVGHYAGEGLNLLKNQLKINGELVNKKLSKIMFGHENEKDLVYLTQDGHSITGKILKRENLKYFSIKFYKALKKISRLVWSKKGVSTGFIYSNLVKVGISLFAEILVQNGYLEYQDDYNNYQINPNTVCYFCGKTHAEHNGNAEKHVEQDSDSDDESDEHDGKQVKSKGLDLKISDSSTEFEYDKKKAKSIPPHTFRPATFIVITGKSNEEALEAMPEDKMNTIKNVFNTLENKDGRNLKFVLGSRVMNEGISLRHVKEVYVLDAYFNFGRIDQVVGRAIRHCSHYKLMSEENVYPIVNVYKFVVALEGALSTEEELYQKAELKYLLIKKIERAMKEVAIDCPLNRNGNIFKEEVEQFKGCEEKGNCPAICDYTSCSFICDDIKLNSKYYDPERMLYKKIDKGSVDYSTFTQGLARNEIEFAKDRIKEMYIMGSIYTLDSILDHVKSSYDKEKIDLFDEFFVFKALDELIPMTENDFNTYKDTIIDKHNRPGYIIYVNKYYIFQPFDQNEDIPMYYRTQVTNTVSQQQLSLYNYLKNTETYQSYREKGKQQKEDDKMLQKEDQPYYNFDDTMDYYDNRDEYDFVGFIDKEVSRRKTKSMEETKDVFKLREKRAKVLEKKRATGVPSLKGAVCETSKSKKYLQKVAGKLGITIPKGTLTRTDVCVNIRDQMLLLEKYSTTKEGNKFTYVMIPADHPTFPFPYNLEDRVEDIVNKIKKEVGSKLDFGIKTKKKTTGPEKGYPSYTITIKNDGTTKQYKDFIEKLGAKLESGSYVIEVE